METLPANTALLIVDLQKAIDDPRWSRIGPRNNPDAEAKVATLLAAWRREGRPIVHIRHDSVEPDSTYRPGGPGHAFKEEALPLPGEMVIGKRVNSAFIGTGLDEWLSGRGVGTLVVAGVITNNSVEATVRMAGNLGYDVRLVADACFTFARLDRSGRLRTADEVHDLSLANMDGEYATVVDTADVLR
ncbi:nicotinamidase-related amidase [Azospirillum lipoferum]|uniref:Cysteine hydrolase n=1 Tax=Azospirillum lipoferum TaxID=193 RepID=A0A5A9GUZ9_AZOLI|nr:MULTISPECIES: cysteine hydrolase family protein [Azospirillum]KAA0598321.1 cysteine hydrolase [Azospirillum lipoferum]MCP1609694.1 nicotinamidase-related amidase [Azospirillum lipoferum]MDW5535001.1 cysteine hydrolase family protein [Azospirillum sp. NL1]